MLHLVARMRLPTTFTFTTRYLRCSLTFFMFKFSYFTTCQEHFEPDNSCLLLVLVWAHSYYFTKKYLIAISYCIYSYIVDKVPLVGYVGFHSITGNKMGHQETLF